MHVLRRLDHELFRRAAAWHAPALDAALPRLSHAANHSVLWMALAVPIALSGRRGRRAAVRGLTSIALASSVTNLGIKQVFRRTRPSLDGVPLIRHVRRVPVTTSFPSGHAASAAAFTTGVSLELPELAIPVGTLAAAVAYSRVHVGVHYPGDVLVGAALGAGLALATAAFRRPGRR